jgi:hypothetical protein
MDPPRLRPQSLFLGTFFRQSFAIFCPNLQIFNLRIDHENLRICDLLTGTPKKFADLQ